MISLDRKKDRIAHIEYCLESGQVYSDETGCWAEWTGKPDMGLATGDDLAADGPNMGMSRREIEAVAAKQNAKAAEVARLRDLATARNREVFGPPKEFHGKTFDDFDACDDKRREALEKCLDWPYHGEDGRYLTLLLIGPLGTGKTLLAAAVWQEQFDVTSSAEFITARALFRRYNERMVLDSELFARYGDGLACAGPEAKDVEDTGCMVLVVDDLGAEQEDCTKESAAIFTEILDRRTSNGLWTVITTNREPKELRAWLGDRGYSRLTMKCSAVLVPGDDYRSKDVRTPHNKAHAQACTKEPKNA